MAGSHTPARERREEAGTSWAGAWQRASPVPGEGGRGEEKVGKWAAAVAVGREGREE